MSTLGSFVFPVANNEANLLLDSAVVTRVILLLKCSRINFVLKSKILIFLTVWMILNIFIFNIIDKWKNVLFSNTQKFYIIFC